MIQILIKHPIKLQIVEHPSTTVTDYSITGTTTKVQKTIKISLPTNLKLASSLEKNALSLELKPYHFKTQQFMYNQKKDLTLCASNTTKKEKQANRNIKKYEHLIKKIIQNFIIGLTTGYVKELELVGVGYRVEEVNTHDKIIRLRLGLNKTINYSYKMDKDIEITNPSKTVLTIKGINLGEVTQVAERIRRLRRPDIYKGTGIHYKGEQFKLKAKRV